MMARYHRGSTRETLAAAQKAAVASQRARYVFSTALGLTIGKEAPPFGLQHYLCAPDGVITYVPSRLAQETEGVKPYVYA